MKHVLIAIIVAIFIGLPNLAGAEEKTKTTALSEYTRSCVKAVQAHNMAKKRSMGTPEAKESDIELAATAQIAACSLVAKEATRLSKYK